MILIKSIPLSFGVLWRFLVVMVVFLPIAIVVTGAFSFIPIVGNFVSAVVTAFATLVGFRVAFQASGAYSAPVFNRLLVGAIKWGMLEALIYGLLTIVLFIFAAGAAQTLRGDFEAMGKNPDFGEIFGLFSGSTLMMGVGIFSIVAFYLVSTALAVPKAATAFSAGNKSPQLPLFWGTGAGFLSILVVSLAGTAIVFYAGAFGWMFDLFLHVIEIFTDLFKGHSVTLRTNQEYAWMAGSVLLYIWSYCWWYAVGGLAFLKHYEKVQAQRFAARPTEIKHEVDLGELRKSRMQSTLPSAPEE